MAISVTCGACGRTVSAKDEAAGKRFRCPGCGQKVVVPDAFAVVPLPAPAVAPEPDAVDDDEPAAATPAGMTPFEAAYLDRLELLGRAHMALQRRVRWASWCLTAMVVTMLPFTIASVALMAVFARGLIAAASK